jgi:hypothetical protein
VYAVHVHAWLASSPQLDRAAEPFGAMHHQSNLSSFLLYAIVQLAEIAVAFGMEDTPRNRMLRFKLLWFALAVCFSGAYLNVAWK